MHDSRFAIIDPACGISGDMLLGALVDLGAGEDWLRALPARLGCPEVAVEVGRVDRAGIQASQVTVRLPGGRVEAPAAPVEARYAHVHGHAHPDEDGHQHAHHAPHGHGAHHRVGDLVRRIEQAPLSDWVRERAIRAFRLLGEAEGRVHGVPADQVQLHEVGALDALVDIVGGIEGFERLGVTRVYRRPVAVGAGWVRASHGVLSVPAPATGILLEGIVIGPERPGHRGGDHAHGGGAAPGADRGGAAGPLARGGHGMGSRRAQSGRIRQRAAGPARRDGRTRRARSW